jgi:hypothetical protein
MMLDTLSQEKRKMVELALDAGRKRQNLQTGLVHFCYESESNKHDTIPLFENACFALALFRSRLSENVLEGKEIIEKILAFRVEGNFPVYLHEYPHCKSRNFSFQLLPVFFYLQKEFTNILGESLTNKLQSAVSAILGLASNLREQNALPKGADAKCKAVLQTEEFFAWQPSSSAEWGDFLLAYQMYDFTKEAPIEVVERAASFWNGDVLSYVGKEKRLMQDKGEPLLTLYDLFMGSLFHTYSDRMLHDHPLHLQASLVYPFSKELPLQKIESPFVFSPMGEDPQRILWGEKSFLHSLVWEGKNCAVQHKTLDQGIDLFFTLPTSIPEEEDDHMEISLYVNLHQKNAISLSTGKGMVFPLDETLHISSFPISWKVTFEVIEGTGRYVGHLSRGNRASQVATKGENRFEAYDYRIAIRTVRRDPNAKIKVSLRIASS